MKKNQLACDVEVYENYFLVMFLAYNGKMKYFELYEDHPLDIKGLSEILQKFEIITFNGRTFDIPLILLALQDASNSFLKEVANRIINENLKWWQIYRQYNLREPDWKHIDLIEPAPGVKVSLKLYGARMHSKLLQDLPIEPDKILTFEEIDITRLYCGNDLRTTADLSDNIDDRIELRRKMSDEYGINLLSKSDAQIAEAVIKSEVEKITGRQVKKIKAHTKTFQYVPPPYIKFKTEQLQKAFDTICNAEFIAHSKGVIESSYGKDLTVTIGNSTYRIGIGGLHSTESEVYHMADDNTLLVDADVSSYYPSIILQLGMYPDSLGPEFLTVFKNITDTRLEAKRNKDKLVADSMKIMINGTFGKLGSVYSIFYAPHLLIQTTITGQLSLLMLIEMMELCGIPVVSANTDGIVMKCSKDNEEKIKKIVSAWEKCTGFEMEFTNYKGIYNRDVNNYIAIKDNCEVKTKGVFAPAGLQKNPTNEICSEALIEYLKNGTPFEETIKGCTDIRKFISARSVTGGAVKIPKEITLPKKTSGKKKMEEVVREFGFYQTEEGNWKHPEYSEPPEFELKGAYNLAFQTENDKLVKEILKDSEYLGKVVRWYYAVGEKGTINYKKNGNKVPRSESAKPCMTLPDEFPDDINCDWYIKECNDFLVNIGVVRRPHPEKIPRKNCKAWVAYLENGDIEEDPENPGKYRWTW